MFEFDPEYDDLVPSTEAYLSLQEKMDQGLKPVKGCLLPKNRVDLTYTRKHRLREYLAHVELLAMTKPIPPVAPKTKASYFPGWESHRFNVKGCAWISAERVYWIRSLLLEILSSAPEPSYTAYLSHQVHERSGEQISDNSSLQGFILPRLLGYLEIEGLVGRCWSRYKANRICYYLKDDFEEEEVKGDLHLAIGDQFIEFKGRTNHDLVTVIDFRPHPNRPGVIVPIVQGKKLGVHYSSKDLLSRVEIEA